MIVTRPKRLAPFVEKLVYTVADSTNPYTVYPNYNHVLGLQIKGSILHIRDGQPTNMNEAGITGIHMGPKLFQNKSLSTSSVLVYFRPESLYLWNLLKPTEIQDQSIGLSDILNISSIWDEFLQNSTQSPYEILSFVEEMIWTIFKNIEIDPWAKWMANCIIQSEGMIRITELAEEAVLSRRQFTRRFTERIGVSPKSFAQIVKFQSILKALKSTQNLTELAFDKGYFDQSHFIKDVYKRTGVSPGELLSNLPTT